MNQADSAIEPKDKHWKAAYLILNANGDAIGFGNTDFDSPGEFGSSASLKTLEPRLLKGCKQERPDTAQVVVVNCRKT